MITSQHAYVLITINAAVALLGTLAGSALCLECIDYLRSVSWQWSHRNGAPDRPLSSKKPFAESTHSSLYTEERISNSQWICVATSRIPQKKVSVEPTIAITLIAYLLAIAIAEVFTMQGSVALGLLCDAGLILLLLGKSVIAKSTPYRSALPVLALAPLLRILSFVLPMSQIPQIYWYAMIGIPFLLAVALTARRLNFSMTHLGLRSFSWPSQFPIALSGLPLSIIAFLILRPKPIAGDLNWANEAIGVVILILFSGFAEEIFFRGILLKVANEHLGRLGLLYSSVLFAIMYFGSLSWVYVVFIGLIGLYFGWCVKRTGSIWGTVLAHSTLSVGTILVWPFIWR